MQLPGMIFLLGPPGVYSPATDHSLYQKAVAMELLEEPKLSDRADQLLAFVLTLICAGLAAYSTSFVRSAVALAGEMADFRRSQFRLANIVGVIVLGIAWFAYTLWVVDSHQQGYMVARIARARGRKMPARFANHPILTWLWKHNLHLAIARFRRNVTIPLVVILIARVIAAVIQTQLVQSP